MSRITLHLKKQGRLHEIIDWDSGGVYTFREGISSTIHNTRLHFTRSHRSDVPGQNANSRGGRGRPTQVTVTIDEVVTRDQTDFLDISDDVDTRDLSIHDSDPLEMKKPVEWHEMQGLGAKGDLPPV